VPAFDFNILGLLAVLQSIYLQASANVAVRQALIEEACFIVITMRHASSISMQRTLTLLIKANFLTHS